MVHRKNHKVSKKPSKRVVKLARKYKVKISVKRGSKRVYKTEKLILRQIRKKMRRVRKVRKVRTTRRVRKVRKVRTSRFGSAGPFSGKVENYGYNLPVNQVPGSRGQSSEWVANAAANASRPAEMRMPSNEVPSFGTYKLFFDQQVPSVLPPNWDFMGQPGGQPPVAVGSPFYNYKTPGFGRRINSRYNFGAITPPMAFPKMPKITRNPNMPKIIKMPKPMLPIKTKDPRITRNPNMPRKPMVAKPIPTKFGRKRSNYGFGEIEGMMYPAARNLARGPVIRRNDYKYAPFGSDLFAKLFGLRRKKPSSLTRSLAMIPDRSINNEDTTDDENEKLMPGERGKKPYYRD